MEVKIHIFNDLSMKFSGSVKVNIKNELCKKTVKKIKLSAFSILI
jgi:hypothetical protein